MPEYKLIYFNLRGRGELARWICEYGKIPYIDKRVDPVTEWPALKPTIPTHQLPVLMVDGKPLSQSVAIARFLAKEAGLVPEDRFLAAQVDAGIDAFSDRHWELRSIVLAGGSDEDKVKRMREELYPKTLAPFLKELEGNLGKKEWYVGNKVTWLDFNSAIVFSFYQENIPNLFEGAPNIKRHTERVMALPGIKEWIARRPKSFF